MNLLNDYKAVMNRALDLLWAEENQEWVSRYQKYLSGLKKRNDKEDTDRVRIAKPLERYTTLSDSIKGGKTMFETILRYRGQEVGRVIGGRLVISPKTAKANIDYFNKGDAKAELGPSPEEGWEWHSDEAVSFRKHFRDLEDAKAKSQEHTFESQFISDLSVSNTNKSAKVIRGIQPITINNKKGERDLRRLQLPTPFMASTVHDSIDSLAYSRDKNGKASSGGGIDVLARRKVPGSNETRVAVIELKDKYEPSRHEGPDRAMRQAVAYATFVREMIRTKGANLPDYTWLNWMGINEDYSDKPLTILCIVAMPGVPEEDLNMFKDMSLRFEKDDKYPEDKLELHFILMDEDTGAIVKADDTL